MKILTCQCGATLEAPDTESVIREGLDHMMTNHPDMIDGKSESDIRSMLTSMVSEKLEDTP